MKLHVALLRFTLLYFLHFVTDGHKTTWLSGDGLNMEKQRGLKGRERRLGSIPRPNPVKNSALAYLGLLDQPLATTSAFALQFLMVSYLGVHRIQNFWIWPDLDLDRILRCKIRPDPDLDMDPVHP